VLTGWRLVDPSLPQPGPTGLLPLGRYGLRPSRPSASLRADPLTASFPGKIWHLPGGPTFLRGGSTAGQGLMVIVPGSVVWVLALSVTATVKVNVPAVVGVPEIPAGGRGSSTRPGGSCPEGIDHR
jgi:hypothetical protein